VLISVTDRIEPRTILRESKQTSNLDYSVKQQLPTFSYYPSTATIKFQLLLNYSNHQIFLTT